ncbi:MAG TPA: hypothetical protein VI140_02670, partial [Oxalicibacterium sp.]
KLNFMALGAPLPESLAGAPSDADIQNLRVGNRAQLILLQEIVEMAERRKIRQSWVRALKIAIAKNRMRFAVPVGAALRRATQPLRTLLRPLKRRLVSQ